MQPSSRRVGPTSARSSASSRVSWLGLGRKSTTKVTAFFGSLAGAVVCALRFGARFFDLRFGIVAGLYSGSEERRKRDPQRASGGLNDLAELGRSGAAPLPGQDYFSMMVRPAFKLSKFRIVFRTSE
jgi:hypothetical protein